MRSHVLLVLALLAACSSSYGSASGPDTEPIADAGVDSVVAASDGGAGSDAGPDAGTRASAYASAVLADAPLAYWRCAEPAGSASLASAVGSHVLLPAPNAPALGLPGLFSGTGRAVGLDGTAGQRLVATNVPFLYPSALAFETWLYAETSATAGAQFVLLHSTGTNAYLLYLYDGTVIFEANTGNTLHYLGSSPIALSEWHHVVAQASAVGMLELYVDGLRSSSVMTKTQTPPPARDFVIGASSDSALPIGPGAKLTEIALYDHVLSATRLTAHYVLAK